MERPDNQQGTVVIRTRFGEVSGQPGLNFTLTLKEMIHDETWRKAVQVDGGPFCYTDWTRNIPF